MIINQTPINEALLERIDRPGAKKILALDGGGIRGVMTLAILEGIETMLRRELKRGDDFRLSDYFDFIAGTSTGAIIATCLAFGRSVGDIKQYFMENGKEMFDRASILERLRNKYSHENLAARLKKELNLDTTLGSLDCKTLLLIVLRNATTDSPWPLSNNPRAKYNNPERDDCNLNLPLWQIVRASAAAPVYFPPEEVEVGPRRFVFVDGGITPFNNPALQAFAMATVEPYNLNWPTGEDRMLVVSVGTGTCPSANLCLDPAQMNIFYNMGSIPSALMFGALTQQDFLCRALGRCLAGDPIDREVGDMIGKEGPAAPKLFTYMRYNAKLTREGLDALGLGDITPADVQKIDSVNHMTELQRIGEAVFARKVKREHFAGFLA